MTGDGRTSRRAVLAALVGGTAAIAVGATGYLVATDDGDGSDEPAEVTLDSSLVALGERYLRDHPDERDEAVLLAALPSLGGTAPTDPETQLASLRDGVAADYDTGDVVELDGWMVTRTEGRAAALYVLSR